ncbi:TetR/AcrR family transcriptional regulator [Rhodobacteraceae bacterium D3-12]|nr:TetR/AcrR family transcriptional regulator [Rhodobacteraceae bacterium D3-12]
MSDGVSAETTAPKQPLPQAQRRERTVQKLCDATIELMVEKGFSRVTTPLVAKRAGVSRGALTHYFASREELIVYAIDHHLTRVNERLFAFAEQIPEGKEDASEIVDYLWDTMSNGLFFMTMEFLPEARINKGFHDALIPVVKEFHEGLDAIWNAFAQGHGLESQRAATVLNMTMCLIRGMIAQTITRDDPTYYSEMLDQWKHILPQLLRSGDRESSAC